MVEHPNTVPAQGPPASTEGARPPVYGEERAEVGSFGHQHPQYRVLAVLPRHVHRHARGLAHRHHICGGLGAAGVEVAGWRHGALWSAAGSRTETLSQQRIEQS